jgi:hypothetical protein
MQGTIARVDATTTIEEHDGSQRTQRITTSTLASHDKHTFGAASAAVGAQKMRDRSASTRPFCAAKYGAVSHGRGPAHRHGHRHGNDTTSATVQSMTAYPTPPTPPDYATRRTATLHEAPRWARSTCIAHWRGDEAHGVLPRSCHESSADARVAVLCSSERGAVSEAR